MVLLKILQARQNIRTIYMDKTIWELMQEFGPLTAQESGGSGIGVGFFTTSEEDQEGNVTKHESYLVEKTDKRIAFSSTYPEARISNLGILKGQYEENLIVNLDFGGAFDWDLVHKQKMLMVIDRRTGQEIAGSQGAAAIGNGAEEDYFPGMANQADIVGDTYVSCRYCFNGITEEQAKNAVFALGGDGSYDELFGGEWTLNFTVDYEDTMKTWDLTENVTVGNIEVKKIQISPVSGVVEFDTLSDAEVDFEEISLNLKNGSKVECNAKSWDSNPGETDSCRVLWKSVVDLDEVQSITVNGTEIAL